VGGLGKPGTSLVSSSAGETAPVGTTTVVQTGSNVSGNQVGGNFDQTINEHVDRQINIYQAQKAATVIEHLLVKLQQEVENNIKCSDMIAKLQRYHGGTVKGGIKGLEGKLLHAERSDEVEDALEQKEMFVKLLEEWSLYSSAQEIFVYLLARAEHYFNSEVLPALGNLSRREVNSQTNSLIVDPIVQECGATVFKIDHLTAMGMVYWLAEQCFVRWH
jgi:hypothetical protein